MLVESSFSSSVETSLLNVSEFQDPFAEYDWASLAETYQMIHKFPEQCQGSFLEASPVPDAMNLDESKHPKLQVSCSEQYVMQKVSEKDLTSLVYSRRKKSVKPRGSIEHSPGKDKKQDNSLDDSIVPVLNPGESTTRKNRFNNCLVYRRMKRRRKSSCSFAGETTLSGDGLDDAFVSELDCGETKRRDDAFSSEHDCGETKRRDDAFVSEHACGETKRGGNRLDNCLVYSRKKGRVKFNCGSIPEHDSWGAKIRGDQAESSAYSQRRQMVKADGGEIKNSGDTPVYCQSKQLVKSNGSFTESYIGETKRNGNRSNALLLYSRKKQRGKSIVTTIDFNSGISNGNDARVNGFLVYRRRKPSMKSRGPKKNANSISHVEQESSARELMDDTQVNEVTSSSDGSTEVDGTNDSCSSLKSSSELASGSSKTGEGEATNCDSSDAGVSETDTDSSSSPFRQCKHCGKPGTVEKMLICDKCEDSYHTSCSGLRMKKVAEIDEWLCPSCLKKKSSKTKIKGRISRRRKLRVTEPFVIGIRIGKEFQADVPDWSGPNMSDTSFVGEPLEIDESEYMHDLKKAKNGKKPCSQVNWLQCREEDTNGDICGKWRRAPRSEVQTQDWECFCCVSWDPSRADCAVPQELETSEILKQLKYIKMLRPRSEAKRRKLGPRGQNRSNDKRKS